MHARTPKLLPPTHASHASHASHSPYSLHAINRERAVDLSGRSHTLIIYAHLREKTTAEMDPQKVEHRHIQVETEAYEAGREQIKAGLPKGWIVASWRVDRQPSHT